MMKKNPNQITLTGACLLLLVGALLFSVGCESSQSIEPSDIVTVAKKDVQVEITEVGVIESTKVGGIVAPFRGRLIRILDDGSEVKKGEVVAVLETEDLEDDLDSEIEELKDVKKQLEETIENLMIDMRSGILDVSSSMAQLDLARVELADVNSNLAELQYLSSRNVVEEDQVREARYQLSSSELGTFQRDMNLRSLMTGSQSRETSNEISLERLELRGKEQLKRIEEAQEQIRKAEIRAMTDGLFIREKRWNWQMRRRVERKAGEEVREDELLGTIPDLSTLIIRSQIPEAAMLRVDKGTRADLVFESLGNLEQVGEVVMIAPVAIERETSAGGQVTASGQELTGEKVFEVLIEMENNDPRMKPGLTVRANIILDESSDTLAIPVEAVSTRNGSHYVRKLNGQKTTEEIEVDLGISNGSEVEVLSGLSEGERVVLPTSG